MDYVTLVGAKTLDGSIKGWVNYEKISATSALTEAQAYIYGAMRSREMKGSATLALAAGASFVAHPADYLDPLSLTIASEAGTEISQRTEAELARLRVYDDASLSTGLPCWYAVYDDRFNFEVAAEDACTLALVYYRRPAALSESNPTNFLTTRYPGILRAACLMAAFDQMSDDAAYSRTKGRLDEMLARSAVEQDFALRGVG